jgi:hypothetical protein
MERLMVPSRFIERPPATISRQKSWSRRAAPYTAGSICAACLALLPRRLLPLLAVEGVVTTKLQATPTRIVYRVFPHVRIKHVWYLGRSCSKKEREMDTTRQRLRIAIHSPSYFYLVDAGKTPQDLCGLGFFTSSCGHNSQGRRNGRDRDTACPSAPPDQHQPSRHCLLDAALLHCSM